MHRLLCPYALFAWQWLCSKPIGESISFPCVSPAQTGFTYYKWIGEAKLQKIFANIQKTESFESRYLMEPADKLALTGEQIFDARCALALLSEATENVRAHYVRRDKARTFELLKAS
jgi:hypothetical protein